MIKKMAYKVVLKDLMQIPMFTGTYDAKNGNKNFMDGICTVMEAIACRAGDKEWEKFDDMSTKNLIESEKKAGEQK